MATDVYYLDISKLGKDFVGNKDAGRLINEQAVVESVLNIIATEPGERVMDPLFGCTIREYLYDPIDMFTSVGIKRAIEVAIEMYEPRVEELYVNVRPFEEENTYLVDMVFSTSIMGKQEKLSFQLNKVR